jgi:methionyl-tRNA formyltransferase
VTRALAIGPDETAGELFAAGAAAGRGAAGRHAGRARGGHGGRDAAAAAGASHARMLTKDDGRIDFARPCAQVAAHVRGVDPWPGAVAHLGADAAKLFGARARPGAVAEAPGTVVAIDDAGAHVACADGVVVVRELQLPGRKRLTARELANGRRLAIGDRLRPTAAP